MAERMLREEAADLLEAGNLDDAAALFEAALADDAEDEVAGLSLARVLVALGRIEEAEELLDVIDSTSLLSELARAEVDVARGRLDAAFERVEDVIATAVRQIAVALVPSDGLVALREEATRLRDTLEIAREEEVEVETARESLPPGMLDRRTAMHFILLGRSLMNASPRVAVELALAPACAMKVRADRLEGKERASLGGLVLRGTVALRYFEAAAAEALFTDACEEDPRSFPAHLGRGAAMLLGELDLAAAVRALRVPNDEQITRLLARVVPDLPALTQLERRVVVASALPLASMLPRLVEAGAILRVLPLDVRPIDRPELAGALPECVGFDALYGLATPTLAVTKVEGLPDVVTEAGWSCAHELAHLVWFHLDEARRAEIEARYAEENDDQTPNASEYFAGLYTDFLREHHGLPRVRERVCALDWLAR